MTPAAITKLQKDHETALARIKTLEAEVRKYQDRAAAAEYSDVRWKCPECGYCTDDDDGLRPYQNGGLG